MSSTLATILLFIAGILIIFGLVALWYNRKLKGLSSAQYQAPMNYTRSPKEELSALGILEIKPRTPGNTAKTISDDEEEHTADADEVEIIEVESDEPIEEDVAEELDAAELDPEEAPHESSQANTDAANGVDVEQKSAVDEILTPDAKPTGVSRREALFRLLNAVQASVDGYTACLIKRDGDGRCHVEAIVSQNPKALGPQSLQLDELLDGLTLAGSAVLIKDIDLDKSPEEILGYYASPVSIRQVAIAPIKAPGDETYFLLVDALGWQDLDDPWQRLMIGQFSTLLGTFMSTPLTEGEEYIKLRVRPRREIIAEEIERARFGKHPLALALIYLNRAEQVANEGGKAIGDAERAMANRLELAVNGGRMERFGELTYGIFQDESVSEVEAWALQLQEELVREGAPFEGGVSIGIALLQDRHKDADDFRADATEALREAFETGACTIIE